MLVLIVKNTCRYVHATLMKLLVVLLILAEQNVEQPTIVLLLVLMLHHHNHVVLPVSKTRSERSSAQLSALSRLIHCSHHCNKYTSCSLNPERRVLLLLRARLSQIEVIPCNMINMFSSAGRTPKDVSGRAGLCIDLRKPGGPIVVKWSSESW